MKARNVCLGLALAGLALWLSGCTTGYVTQGGPAMQDVMGQAYNGPKARVAVARFENKVEGNMLMSIQRQIAQLMAQAQKAMAAPNNRPGSTLGPMSATPSLPGSRIC